MKKPDHWAYVFILPFFIVFGLFNAYPIISNLWISLTNESQLRNQVTEYVGFKNYLDELSQPLFWQALINNWIIWLPNIFTQIGVALFLAAILTNHRMKIRGSGIFRAVFFFPNLVTISSIGVLLFALFEWQTGPVNQILFGSDKSGYIDWLRNPTSAQFIVSMSLTWMWFGYTMILFIAGIVSIPDSYFEAAIMDGATESTVFFKVTLPLLTPVMTYVLITSLIGGMGIFDLPWVLTSSSGFSPGGVDNSLLTNAMYIYQRAFSWNKNLGSAAAVSWIVFLFLAGLTAFYLKFIQRYRGEQQ
jgi:ABC-type sugar transport system permease subunit